MIKRVYKYFGAMIELQEKWLNSMSEKGYKLTKCARTYYEFEKCEPGEYKYKIELVIDKSPKVFESIKKQLTNLGIGFFSKNISLNTIFGMVLFKSPLSFASEFTCQPELINKELLIIETFSDDNRCITINCDDLKIKYYKKQRNSYFFLSILWLILAFFMISKSFIVRSIIFFILTISFSPPIFIYQNHIKLCNIKKKNDFISENN